MRAEFLSLRESDFVQAARALGVGDARLIEGPHWAEPWPSVRFEKRNALAYRMALVAAGAFDAAIALTPKWDWDVAAGSLIAEEAGCFDAMEPDLNLDGLRLVYEVNR